MDRLNERETAWMPSLLIQLLAGAFLAGIIAWASHQTVVNFAQASDIAVIQTTLAAQQKQWDRIEGKLDEALISKQKP